MATYPDDESEQATPEQLAEGLGVDVELLDREFPSDYKAYLRFGKHVTTWNALAPSLGLTAGEIQTIRADLSLTGGMHEREVLKKWKAKNGFRARYRRLVEAYLELEERGAAEAICKEIGKFGECVVRYVYDMVVTS